MNTETYIKGLENQVEMLDDASDYWKEQFEMLFNEVNEHGVLADVLQKWEGESNELNKINKL